MLLKFGDLRLVGFTVLGLLELLLLGVQGLLDNFDVPGLGLFLLIDEVNLSLALIDLVFEVKTLLEQIRLVSFDTHKAFLVL